MSWLKQHFMTFVVSGIRTLVRDYMSGPNGQRGIRAETIKPYDGIVRASQKCRFEEAGLVYATLASLLPKNDPKNLREPLLKLCQTLDGGELTGARTGELADRYAESPSDVVHSIIWNSMRSLRRRAYDHNKGLLLLGRDVWPWEVLSRRRRVASVYDPAISRGVAGNPAVLKKRADSWQADLERSILFDTGFAGSIHRCLVAATRKKPELVMLSSGLDPKTTQLFPGHTGSRAKALAIEYFPKYWQSGRIEDNEAVQYLAGLEEFVKSALLTVWIWHHVSPRYIRPQRKPRPKAQVPSAWSSAAQDIVTVQPMTGNTSIAYGNYAPKYSFLSSGTNCISISAATTGFWQMPGGDSLMYVDPNTFELKKAPMAPLKAAIESPDTQNLI